MADVPTPPADRIRDKKKIRFAPVQPETLGSRLALEVQDNRRALAKSANIPDENRHSLEEP